MRTSNSSGIQHELKNKLDDNLFEASLWVASLMRQKTNYARHEAHNQISSTVATISHGHAALVISLTQSIIVLQSNSKIASKPFVSNDLVQSLQTVLGAHASTKIAHDASTLPHFQHWAFTPLSLATVPKAAFQFLSKLLILYRPAYRFLYWSGTYRYRSVSRYWFEFNAINILYAFNIFLRSLLIFFFFTDLLISTQFFIYVKQINRF